MQWHCKCSMYYTKLKINTKLNYYPTFCMLRERFKNKHFLQMLVWPRIRLTKTPDISVPQGWSVYTLLMLVSSLRNTGKRFIDQADNKSCAKRTSRLISGLRFCWNFRVNKFGLRKLNKYGQRVWSFIQTTHYRR